MFIFSASFVRDNFFWVGGGGGKYALLSVLSVKPAQMCVNSRNGISTGHELLVLQNPRKS